MKLAIAKEKVDNVKKNTPILKIINNVVVPTEKHYPNRSLLFLL